MNSGRLCADAAEAVSSAASVQPASKYPSFFMALSKAVVYTG
jgi:hypothetical protein